MTSSGGIFDWILGTLLGVENLRSIDQYELTFAEPWANRAPAWVFLGCAALAVLSFWFYYKYQFRARGKTRAAMATARAVVLSLLFIILANPVLRLSYTNNPRPLLYVLFDGTDSMAIEDDMTEERRTKLAESVGLTKDGSPTEAPPEDGKLSRIAYVQALLKNEEKNPLKPLSEKFRVRAFLLDRPDGVRSLELGEIVDGELDLEKLTGQLTTDGQVTALGKAFEDLRLRHATGHLAGVLVFSDFAQNSGPAPVGSLTSPAQKLERPVYTVGVGPEAAADLSVSLSTRPLMKKAERDTLMVTLRQNQLTGRTVTVRVTARRLSGESGAALGSASEPVGSKTVELAGATIPVEFPYTPEETGRFEFLAEVDPLEEEVVDQNNRSAREVNVRDDFLRLMYIAHEPSWEWRFIKEVFHRDKLVGMRGFRTFLRSSDPKVRATNPLFMPTLTPPRSEFFANDVIFLGDMPGATLSTRFCEMTKEYVSKFGGGLVVLAGPRFGPAELAGTPLADMLPVVVDAGSQLRDQREFRPRLTPEAEQVDFMQLGGSPSENRKAWDNLGELPWYQPVSRVHPLAAVLASHPTDKCVDGKTPQPIIAIRKYGKGEVVYLATDETWRLRRKYGELYYRQFWGQMIYHLGLRHALGSQKRFVVRTDRQQYQADDSVLLTVEAYDENFQPISDEKLIDHKLMGDLVSPGQDGEPPAVHPVNIPYTRDGVFEARIPVLEGGEHRIRVRDPITREYSEVVFQVTSVSAERQSAVRNVALQREIAQATGGKAYDLENVSNLVHEIELPTITESTTKVFALWSTWFCFLLVVLLMLGEWLVRKWVNLA